MWHPENSVKEHSPENPCLPPRARPAPALSSMDSGTWVLEIRTQEGEACGLQVAGQRGAL